MSSLDFASLQSEAKEYNYSFSDDGQPRVLDPEVLSNPFPYFVGTKVASLAQFRPTYLGYLMPTKEWAIIARQYENTLLEHIGGIDPQANIMYPIDSSEVREEEKVPENFFQETAVLTLLKTFKQTTALLYQTTNSPQSDSIHSIPTVTGTKTHNNNQWYGYSIQSSPISKASMTMIYPAQPWDIKKYCDAPSTLITETPQLYNSVHLPRIIESTTPAKLQWVYDLLEGKKERDTVAFVFNDQEMTATDDDDNTTNNGFMVAKDTKWPMGEYIKAMEWSSSAKNDGVTALPFTLAKSMWYLSFPLRHDLHSIRDLNETHLVLLKTMREKVLKYLKEKFGFTSQDVVMYFHYVPTFYHLHLHINHVSAVTETTYTGKVEELDSIISNIEMCNDYYQKCTRRINLKLSDPLTLAFQKAEHKQ